MQVGDKKHCYKPLVNRSAMKTARFLGTISNKSNKWQFVKKENTQKTVLFFSISCRRDIFAFIHGFSSQFSLLLLLLVVLS